MAHAQIVGVVPEEFRYLFSTPIPDVLDSDPEPDWRCITKTYEGADEFAADQSCGEYNTLFRTVAALADLTCCPTRGSITCTLVQAPANLFVEVGNDQWHAEDFFSTGWIGLLASNRFGTQYLAEDGSEQTAPDFGVLRLGRTSMHRAQAVGSTLLRTRLFVSSEPHGVYEA